MAERQIIWRGDHRPIHEWATVIAEYDGDPGDLQCENSFLSDEWTITAPKKDEGTDG